MPRKSKILTISLPKKIEDEVKKIAEEEAMTVSELCREALRQYLRKYKQDNK